MSKFDRVSLNHFVVPCDQHEWLETLSEHLEESAILQSVGLH